MDYLLRNNPKKRKAIIFIVIVGIILTSAVVVLWDYSVTQKVITLNPTPGTTITIGTSLGEAAKIDKIIAKSSNKQQIRLAPGDYAVVYSGPSGYRDEYKKIVIEKSMELKTPKLSMTQDKLDQLLVVEKPSAQKVILSLFSTNEYSLVDDRLYQSGDWYGARLVYKDNSRDMMRVILKKENGKWKAAAGPEVIISIDDYPNIPQVVIRNTNRLGFY